MCGDNFFAIFRRRIGLAQEADTDGSNQSGRLASAAFVSARPGRMTEDSKLDSVCSVSIGIPTYQRPERLKVAITSAVTQSYPYVFVQVSDNCSDEATVEACSELAARFQNLSIYRQAMNVGAPANFMAVKEQAIAPLFMWLADDDWIDRRYVEECVRCLQTDPDVVLAYGVPKYYRGEEFILDGASVNLTDVSNLWRLVRYFWTVRDNAMFYGVFRKAALDGISFPKVFGGDWLFMARILAKGKAKLVPSVSIHRSLDGSSASSTQLSRSFAEGGVRERFPYTCLGIRAAKIVFSEGGRQNTSPFAVRLIAAVMVFLVVAGWKGGSDFIGRLMLSVRQWVSKT